MQYEAYRDLIQRLEEEASADPRGYTRRVGLFGVLGYAYIVVVLAAIVTLIVVLPRLVHVRDAWISFKLAFLLVPIGWALVSALLVRIPSPRGVVLTRARAPALFAMIDEVTLALHAPKPDRVLLHAGYNCSILQRPRLGVFGWPENILMLGLPMLETLSRPRFRSVLAHEFGHLAAHHSTFAGRLHTVSNSWRHLLHRLDTHRSVLMRLFEPFFRWYGPRFQAMGFVLGRRQEHFADACARKVAGVRATRSALVRIDVMARHYREVMEHATHPRVRERPVPPQDLVPAVARRMREDPPADEVALWIDEAMRAETGYEHTHPALKDRLEAIERGAKPVTADALAEPGVSAAQDLLGSELESLALEASAIWTVEIAAAWKQRHERLAEAARTASGADPAPPAGTVEPEAAWRAVSAHLEIDRGQDARGRLAEFLASHPDHAVAHFRMGQVMIEDGEAAGLPHLERSMALDSDATPAACAVAVHFLRAQGRARDAEDYTRRAWEFSELARQAEDERRVLRRRDRLVPHDLPAETIASLRRRLSAEPWVAAAWLVRREVTLRPDKPAYVFGLRIHRPWYKYVDVAQQNARAMTLLKHPALPAGTWMFAFEGELRWARKKCAQVDRALIWSRPRRGAGSVPTAKAA